MLKLRYHHLLCLYYFKGYGYNKQFIGSMLNIKNRLDEDIIITSSFDDICNKCPNKVNECLFIEKVERYDNNLKKITKLKENKIYTYKELTNILNPIIKDENRCHISGDCEWSEYCK